MENKFNMTLEENIFVAKRNIVDYIWKEAKLEGIAVTFPETSAIYEGVNVPNMSVRDIIVINNLKHSWQFMLDTIDYPFDVAYICQINKEVGSSGEVFEAGKLRHFDVSIGGTTWKPKVPDYDEVVEKIRILSELENPTDKAIETMLYLMRSQLFNDGNKRTAQIVANKIMIENGCGIISIPSESLVEFKTQLIDFYESNDSKKIKKFIYDNCIDGIDFGREKEKLKEEPALEPLTNKKQKLKL